MGRRGGDLTQRCCLVFLLMIYGSGGLSISPPFAISPSSTNQDLLATPPYSVESRSIHAPSPLNLPIGSIAHPPVIPPSMSKAASPIVQGIVPLSQLISPPYHSINVSTSPSIQPQSPNVVSPIIHSAPPTISISPQTPATNAHKSPGLISPPQASQAPHIFHTPDHDLSPSHVNSPSIQVRNGTPTSDTWGKLPNGSPLTLPHAAAPAPTVVRFNSPDVQPNIPKLAPSMTHPPDAKDLNGSAVSPVVAPSIGTSNHLSPTNSSQFDGSSPAISPMPLESSVTHAPSTMHPRPSEERITTSPPLAPAISIPGHEDGKRGNPAHVPSYSSASSNPPTPFEKNRRGHYPSTPFVQAPVVSPAHLPSPIPKDKRNYASPVISPAPLLPSPWNKGLLHTPPFVAGHVISPAPGNPPAENPKHRMSHFAPPPNEGPEVHLAPSHPPTPFSKNNRRPLAPSPYVDDPVVIPAPSHPPMDIQRIKRNHQTPPSYQQGPYFPPVQAPFSSPSGEKAATPTQSPLTPQRHNRWPTHYPATSPSTYSKRSQSPLLQPIHALPPSPPNLGPIHHLASSPSTYSRGSQPPLLQPMQALPPPPPNLDCGPISCPEPLANPPLGSPCTCVLPIKVGLRLGVALYTFFPLVSEFAQEISSGVFMKQSQVRIMGANAASEDPEKTVVLIDLVPLGKYFDNTTVFLTYVKFWHKHVAIQPSYFGDYDVLYVQYPGLPPSPPSAPGYVNVDGGAYSSGGNARAIRPLGVDVRRQKKRKLSGSLVAIIVLSSVVASFLILGAACFLFLRRREHSDLPVTSSQPLQTPLTKPSASGTAPMTAGGSGPSSTSGSLSSSIATLASSAKSYSLYEIEKATNKFDELRIIGEGGFGRVYLGILEDGARVAIKVLKRDDQQGGREFMAEVEMLSRLHHRNLVKLMGTCTEENTRCLVYELIPNGSLESHLHGVDKEVSPLDWNTRMKIALGAARGLAYLHEDSSPRVIHRDFKSSNILLEHDFTPKVSDFGLARTALDEGSVHISTRVMGTFGYVAPEYAMTGHLLVKSDVYSYGVVLLELLTGRKPVDMSQPPGQENLVSWARPLLTKAEGLDMITDPALGANFPQDSIAKVAAIASMCVQPEVSHRPFMGEVVQALKLVCSESDECRHSESCSNDESSTKGADTRINIGLSGGPEMIGTSQSVMFYSSAGFTGDGSGFLQMHSSSGPLRTGRGSLFWSRLRGLASGSASEHRFMHRFWTNRSEHSEP